MIWLVGTIFILPHPFNLAWGQALLLLAPLVLLPLGMDLVSGEETERFLWVAQWLQLPSAVLLGAAYFCPQGVLAGCLALPWLLTTVLIALTGLARIFRRGLTPLAQLCSDAGMVYIAVGAAWAVADRLGIRPLDFDATIVLLTAIHFHYAGFALALATGLVLRLVPGPVSATAGVGVIAGVPLVAAGITATQLGADPVSESVAALWLATAGALCGGLHLWLALRSDAPRLIRVLWGLASVSLLGSMILAGLYGVRFFVPVAWLDIPWMRALHGTANAFGFALASLIGWHLSDGSLRAAATRA